MKANFYDTTLREEESLEIKASLLLHIGGQQVGAEARIVTANCHGGCFLTDDQGSVQRLYTPRTVQSFPA